MPAGTRPVQQEAGRGLRCRAVRAQQAGDQLRQIVVETHQQIGRLLGRRELQGLGDGGLVNNTPVFTGSTARTHGNSYQCVGRYRSHFVFRQQWNQQCRWQGIGL